MDVVPVRDLVGLAWHLGRDDPLARDMIDRALIAATSAMTSGVATTQLLGEWRRLVGECHLFRSHYSVDSNFQYLEWNRDLEKRFYLPRRISLQPITQALQDILDDNLAILSISQPPGTGKQLADYTPILTKDGWKTHGELVVGDYVIGIDGEFKKVTHVFPKAMQDCRVHFTNGDYIDCHENHEWPVHDRYAYKGTYDRVYDTKTIEGRKLSYGGNGPGSRGHRYILSVPVRQPIVGEHKTLPVAPYTFGAWLGDGSNNTPCVTLSKDDIAIIDSIEKDGYRVNKIHVHKTTKVPTYTFHDLRFDLQEMGFCHSRRRVPKFIPDIYLTASLDQRLDLLAGLVDTDGVKSDKRKYTITTAEPELKDSIVALINTFGWRACVVEEKPRLSSSGIQGKKPYWVIGFSAYLEIPCRLARKQYKSPPGKPWRFAIKSVERIEPTIGNCIEVEGGIYLAGKSMIPTHNSTIISFFMSMMMGLYPDRFNLITAHSDKLTMSLFEGILSVVTDPEYTWQEIFSRVPFESKSVKNETINLGEKKRFKTLTCRSIDGTLTGATRFNNLMVADDLVSGIEEALNINRMDKLWEKVTNDLRSRGEGRRTKEIYVATRWSVHDPIGRLERFYGDKTDRFRSVVAPALDENDESNFDFDYGLGFSTQYYHDLRDTMDDLSWRALYMNEPVEREGLLFPEETLRRYYKVPDGKPDAIISVCDTKDRGTDYGFLPVAFVYGNDYYIEDCICDNGLPEKVEARFVDILLRHDVHMSQFESNAAGGRVADKVQSEVRVRGGRTHITKKWTSANKETKILVNSHWVKEHCLFKDSSEISPRSDYATMMRLLLSYTQTGKNKNDDVPDGLAMLSEFAQASFMRKAEIIARPF